MKIITALVVGTAIVLIPVAWAVFLMYKQLI